MKKISLFLSLLMAIFFTKGQTQLTVAAGTETTQDIPIIS